MRVTPPSALLPIAPSGKGSESLSDVVTLPKWKKRKIGFRCRETVRECIVEQWLPAVISLSLPVLAAKSPDQRQSILRLACSNRGERRRHELQTPQPLPLHQPPSASWPGT